GVEALLVGGDQHDVGAVLCRAGAHGNLLYHSQNGRWSLGGGRRTKDELRPSSLRPPSRIGSGWPVGWPAHQSPGLERFLSTILGPAGMEGTRTIDPPVGVRAEVVAQPLEQARRAPLAPVAVVVGQRRTEGRYGHARVDRQADHLAPGVLRACDGIAK